MASFYYCSIGVLLSWCPVFFVLPILPWANLLPMLAAAYVWNRSTSRCETTETVLITVLPILLNGVSLTANLMHVS
jgi:hypothetical protein